MTPPDENDRMRILLQGFRSPELCREAVRRIHAIKLPDRKIRLMEVCGTHTMAIHRFGIRALLPPGVELLSGPGCPVCVTPPGVIGAAVAASRKPGVIVTAFGDLIRVPGVEGTLAQAGAEGGDIRVVYSPLDAVEMARAAPGALVVFPAVGFETTAPAIAAAVIAAHERGLDNFLILPAGRLIPPAMRELAVGAEVDGFICPGHVGAVIGAEPFGFLAREHGKPCVIAGFEPLDILLSILTLLEMSAQGRAEVVIQYARVVRPEGNPRAVAVMDRVFEPVDSEWRGLGVVPRSGLRLREAFAAHGAEARLGIEVRPGAEPQGCICGEVLKGASRPTQCPRFDRDCTPLTPVGACMVSPEGACAAYYKYSRD